MPHPPKYAHRFLRWFCKEDFLEEIEGDLIELFDLTSVDNSKKARRNFNWGVLTHFRPDYIKDFQPNIHLIHPAMIRHNFLITYRSFLRNKSSFLINLIGLSTGLAAFLLIHLWVKDELSVDKFHEKDRQIYKVKHNLEFAAGTSTWEETPLILGSSLLEEMPEVQQAVAVNNFFHWISKEGIISHNEKYLQVQGRHATEGFFEMFSYPLLMGKKENVLAEKQNIVISRDLAVSLFASVEESIGKFVEWDNPSFEGTYKVSGVFENIPPYSTEQFDVVFTMGTLEDFVDDHNLKNFRGSYAHTYLQLANGTDIDQFNQKIYDYMEVKDPINTLSRLFVQKYSDQYLYGIYDNGQPRAGRISYVRLLSAIGIFLLLIACVNFMNLTTARASTKLKEIGVKKAIGATRKSLVIQYLSEALLLSILSAGLAILIVYILLPQFNLLTGKQLGLQLSAPIWISIGLITLITGLIAGSYPALYLSGFKPLIALKEKFIPGANDTLIRKGLVVFQFTLSTLFIVGFLVINRQVQYTQNKNLGYNRNNVISFEWKRELYDPWTGLNEEGNSNQAYYSFLEKLRSLPGVDHASSMKRTMLDYKQIVRQSGVTWKGEEGERDHMFISPVVGFDFIETLGIPIKEGRSFSQEMGDNYNTVVLNEAAVKLMEFEKPVGQIVGVNGESKIIGVVKDFHYGSLHNSIEPLIFRLEQHGPNILVKLVPNAEKATLEQIDKLYQEFHPHYSFEYRFMDEDYQALYESETKVAQLSNYFAGLSILISCLGLFGLAAFMTERRKKEIGIRKVLGASVYKLVQLLSLDFSKMVMVAILIATPIGYLMARYWLDSFSEKIPIQGWYFAAGAVGTLLIAWLTVSAQTYRAARVNPVECLKDE